jgi:hypothetical protein
MVTVLALALVLLSTSLVLWRFGAGLVLRLGAAALLLLALTALGLRSRTVLRGVFGRGFAEPKRGEQRHAGDAERAEEVPSRPAAGDRFQ